MLEKIYALDVTSRSDSQSEYTSYLRRRSKLAHAILPDHILPGRSRQDKERAHTDHIGLPGVRCQLERFGWIRRTQRHLPRDQQAQTHYDQLRHVFLLFQGQVRCSQFTTIRRIIIQPSPASRKVRRNQWTNVGWSRSRST